MTDLHDDLPPRLRTVAGFLGAEANTSAHDRVPESTKALTRLRPFIPGARLPVFPLRDVYGRTWAEKKALGL